MSHICTVGPFASFLGQPSIFILPFLGADPILDVEAATICECEAPKTRLRKNIVVNQFVWNDAFSDPTDFDFQSQKGKWEEYLNSRLSSSSLIENFDFGGITILSMKPDPVSDTSIHLQTEILFAVESNGTEISDELDKITFGSLYYSNISTEAFCNLGNLSAEFPATDPFLKLGKCHNQ